MFWLEDPSIIKTMSIMVSLKTVKVNLYPNVRSFKGHIIKLTFINKAKPADKTARIP